MNDSRFQTVVLLHDHGDNCDGQVAELARILAEGHPNVKFLHPPVPTALEAKTNFNLLAIKLLPIFQLNSLVVGLGLSGLFAIDVQDGFPHLNLSVFAVNPPSDELALAWRGTGRVVLYSSQYEPIKASQPEKWSEHTDYAFDVPWLSGGVRGAMYATSYLISAYMRGLDLKKEVLGILPSQAQTEAAGI